MIKRYKKAYKVFLFPRLKCFKTDEKATIKVFGRNKKSIRRVIKQTSWIDTHFILGIVEDK